MSNLTDDLKGEHMRLLNLLQDISDAGLRSAEAPALVARARDLFIAHLTREDAELYGHLETAAETDGDLRKTLLVFTGDIPALTREVMSFLDAFNGPESPDNPSRAFVMMFQALRTRIKREEDILFPVFDRRMHQPG